MKDSFCCEKTVGVGLFVLVLVALSSMLQLVGAQNPDLGSVGGSQGWWSQVLNDISEREYHIREIEQHTADAFKGCQWQAPNRRQNLRVGFSHNGLQVVPRSTDKQQWSFGLDLVGCPEVKTTRVNANRIELQRSDALVEWYINDERGVEQGFTLNHSKTDQITLDLAVQGDLVPTMPGDDNSIIFSNRDGVKLIEYSGLKAWDAAGMDLSATMSLNGKVVRLSVDAAKAIYPVTIDPLISTCVWVGEGNQGHAHYGFSVSTAGDVNGDGYDDVIIGSPRYDNGGGDEGAAFVYYGSSSGFGSDANWVMKGTRFNTRFGYSVSTAGDVNGDGYDDVIIGAPWHEDGNTTTPYISIYHGSKDGLSVIPAWVMDANQQESKFGSSVACAGDLNGDGFDDVIVGEPEYDNPGELHEGRARVYYGSRQGVSTGIGWVVEGNQQEARFGSSVAGAGDVNGDGYDDVIIGAEWYSNGDLYEGKVFVYHGSENGLTYSLDWWAEGNEPEVRFGHSVSPAGDVNNDGFDDVIIGSPYYDFESTDEGCVFVYYGSDQGLSNSADWVHQGIYENGGFGSCVSTAGDVNADGCDDIIIGEPAYNKNPLYHGAAYIYYGSKEGVFDYGSSIIKRLADEDSFGFSLCTAGDINNDGCDDLIVGAYQIDRGLQEGGMAFLYYGFPVSVPVFSNWMAENNQNGCYFGDDVCTAGDVNGDGYDDVIVGAPLFDTSLPNAGMALVYHGSETGLSITPSWVVEGGQAEDCFGDSVSTAGDINGDGYDDIIVGAYQYTNGEYQEGAVFVYYGSMTGLSHSPGDILEGNLHDSTFSSDIASAGDVNGDGYDDIVVGALCYRDTMTDQGAAFVYLGSETGISHTASWFNVGEQPGAMFGYTVSSAGDVNGDGYDDIIIGALTLDDNHKGYASVFLGSATGVEATSSWTVTGDSLSWQAVVSTAGDVNGDGYDDVIVAAMDYDNEYSDQGKVSVYHGSDQGLSTDEDWFVEGGGYRACLGVSVSNAGDVNNDGYDDIIIVAGYLGDNEKTVIYIYTGSETGLSNDYSWMMENKIVDSGYGSVVSTAGDVNNDGYSDVMVGGGTGGSAFVYYGPQYNMKYTAGDNGSLHGITLQSAWSGNSGYPVKAVADKWYRFERWSDGSTENPRLDENVTETIDVIAIFEFDGSGAWMLQ